MHNFTFSPDNLCTENAVQIVPISGLYGSGPMSEPNIIPPPRPQISPRLKLLSMVYEPKRYFAQNYEANGTITITFQYEPSLWPLGDEDLEVVPMFHMMLCAEPDLTQAVPVVSQIFKIPCPQDFLVARVYARISTSYNTRPSWIRYDVSKVQIYLFYTRSTLQTMWNY